MKKIYFLTLVFLLVVFQLPAYAVSFVEKYDYDAGEADSKLTCRSISLLQVKRLLVERLGTYLESNTVVTNYQVTRDEIISFSAGVVKTEILEEYWDGKTYRLKARIEADPQTVARMIEEMKKSGKRVDEFEETNEKYMDRINELKDELTKTQSDFVQITRSYQESSKIISAWDAFETGQERFRSGDMPGAIASFTTAIDANPKWIYYYHRGRCYRRAGQYQKAVKDFNTVIRMDPAIARAYFERGQTLMKYGKKRKGWRDIRRAANLGSGDAKRMLKLKMK
jgi:tetratricopeptide (TPR) repeat protein